ncbi:hypothetical protein GPA27_20130 [Aromatoleum toluolicum]|uniref:Uncharacterized protein n=1 Tax=Aromatoleum toluolicum TaxID=90060 RepID=A0ABX1NK73_9RHOO|nr:hypothetical protein [Aromatoleum toluolicum]NMF99690.1 hypothetical protein [Aromatoleum toluolicum]
MTETLVPLQMRVTASDPPNALGVRSALSSGTVLVWSEQKTTMVTESDATTPVVKEFHSDGLPPSPVERVYPQLFDDEGPAGQARTLIVRALNDARLALDAFGEADLDSIGSRLAAIAALMAEAHRLTYFNESLGAVVSFIRRATLVANSADTSRPALNALMHVLKSLSENPAIDLEDAGELIDILSHEGWCGEHELGAMLIAAVLGDVDDLEGGDRQAALFDVIPTQCD